MARKRASRACSASTPATATATSCSASSGTTARRFCSGDREFFRNGWVDPGSNAGGFFKAPGFSPNTTGQPVQRAARRRRPPSTGFRGHAGLPSLRGVLRFSRPARAWQRASSRCRTRRDLLQPDGPPFALAGARGYNQARSGATNSTATATPACVSNRTATWSRSLRRSSGYAVERRSVFGRATLDLNDNLTAFAQATYSNIQVTTRGGYPPAITVWQAPVPNDGRPIRRRCRRWLACTHRPGRCGRCGRRSASHRPWKMFRGIDFMGGPYHHDGTDAYQLMAGVEGTLRQRDWTWEAYVSIGETNEHELLRQPAVVAALPVPHRRSPTATTLLGGAGNGNWGRGTFARGRNYAQTCTSGLPMFTTLEPGRGPCVGRLPRGHQREHPLADGAHSEHRRGQLARQDRRHAHRRAAVRGRRRATARTSSVTSPARPTTTSRSSSSR